MTFKKGEVTNPNGNKPSKPFLDALNRAIKQDDSKKIRKAADSLLNAAAAGEPWAIGMLADRTDGKAVQQVDATVETNLTVEIVRYADQTAE